MTEFKAGDKVIHTPTGSKGEVILDSGNCWVRVLNDNGDKPTWNINFTKKIMESDPVNHPSHYTSDPSGIECIQVAENLNFCLGNALKYIWRCDDKGKPIEDLKKARWYLDREIARREKEVGE